ncbi:M23 family metallopeptidase [Streptomyces sp. NPDC018833]|uniref:M23 family metallopeptidase n=1 Tax=Streptomyces sp. NPDC018833 TaxID=3365053 RepID=UPI0037891EFB
MLVGATARAATGGTVASTGWDDGFCYEVVVKHDDGEYTQYAHLSRIDGSSGATVEKGRARRTLRCHRHCQWAPPARREAHHPVIRSAVDPLDWLRDHGVET